MKRDPNFADRRARAAALESTYAAAAEVCRLAGLYRDLWVGGADAEAEDETREQLFEAVDRWRAARGATGRSS